ncbi:unnamed protein product [Owenia fusiformis]|uniref:Uncharacterized protein n=1 Tax=Owenia fusiformis TaxID=6347 RepID=A0A8J1UW04_OWEFU|nr:unnamed protein product [Owenia fusiformis]
MVSFQRELTLGIPAQPSCRRDLKLGIPPHPMTLDGVVHFHLTLEDAARPSGCIVNPIQPEWPQMLKISNGSCLQEIFIYTQGDHVVIRTFKLKLIVVNKVKRVGCMPYSSKFARLPRQEFDYMITCCTERGIREYMRAIQDDLAVPNQALATPLNAPHHLGLGYEFKVHSDINLFEVTSTYHDRVKQKFTQLWSVYLNFEEMEDVLKNIHSLIPPLAIEDMNCIATLHGDHMNQEGMWACNVCQYLSPCDNLLDN